MSLTYPCTMDMDTFGQESGTPNVVTIFYYGFYVRTHWGHIRRSECNFKKLGHGENVMNTYFLNTYLVLVFVPPLC